MWVEEKPSDLWPRVFPVPVVALPQFELSRWTCNATCLCWWLNPSFRALGYWYDFGAGLAFNSIVNSFIGDALMSWKGSYGYCVAVDSVEYLSDPSRYPHRVSGPIPRVRDVCAKVR